MRLTRLLSTVLGGAVGGEPVLVLSDAFIDTADVSLDAHVIAPLNTPGTSWTEQAGNWKINASAQATLVTTLDNAIATVDAGIADCIVRADVISNASNNTFARDAGIVVRYVDAVNYWAVTINLADIFRIVEVNAGVATVRATAAVTIDPATAYTIRVSLSGQTISATLNGANQLTYGSAALNETATKHGIKARAATTDLIDDFEVFTNP